MSMRIECTMDMAQWIEACKWFTIDEAQAGVCVAQRSNGRVVIGLGAWHDGRVFETATPRAERAEQRCCGAVVASCRAGGFRAVVVGPHSH